MMPDLRWCYEYVRRRLPKRVKDHPAYRSAQFVKKKFTPCDAREVFVGNKQRITIKIPPEGTAEGRKWGDYHFGRSLAQEFNRRGHCVHLDFHNGWDDEATAGDDYIIVLRGKKRYHHNTLPKKAVLWIISHPQEATLAECSEFDTIYCASPTLTAHLGTELQVPVKFFPQCTDANLFYPDPIGDLDTGRPLFVGNAGQRPRHFLHSFLSAGQPVDVYGGGWEYRAIGENFRGSYIPNDKLRHYYSSAPFVINDTATDMRADFIVPNRVFDALACGAAVITNDFKSDLMAQARDAMHCVYDDKSLRDAFEIRGRERRKEVSDWVRENHTFRNRVDVLLEDWGLKHA